MLAKFGVETSEKTQARFDFERGHRSKVANVAVPSSDFIQLEAVLTTAEVLPSIWARTQAS